MQRRQIEPISLFRKARAECRGEKLAPQLLKKVDRDGMSLRDCLRGGKCLYFCVNTRHLHRKAAHVPGIEKMKDLPEESSVSVPPRIGSLKRICFASFSYCNKLTSPGRCSSGIHESWDKA